MKTPVAKKKQTAFRLDDDLLEKLKEKADRENRSPEFKHETQLGRRI